MKRARKPTAPLDPAPRQASAMRLPPVSMPVIRGVATDPLRMRIGASGSACQACLQSCSRLGARLRGVSESLCMAVC
jgi:hypothetical protein